MRIAVEFCPGSSVGCAFCAVVGGKSTWLKEKLIKGRKRQMERSKVKW